MAGRSEDDVYVILYMPQLAEMAKGVAQELGSEEVICATSYVEEASNAVVWGTFPSESAAQDPNILVDFAKIADRKVVLLVDQSDATAVFASLSLVLWLQRFIMPHPSERHAAGKWKQTVHDGSISVKAVRSLTVIVPWFRFCQMERTSRWQRTGQPEKPWTNTVPTGPWLDVPSAQTFVALLSADPPPAPPGCDAPPLPPKEVLFVDPHDDLNGGVPVLEWALGGTGKWANPRVPYELASGEGTYFTSAFCRYLTSSSWCNEKSAYVVFPDVGAYRRFQSMVAASLPALQKEQILFIEKKRVGEHISQDPVLLYMDEAGERQTLDAIPAGARVLIADDFTNSGSTLFGGASIVRKFESRGDSTVKVCAFVTHFVAKYSRELVAKFVDKLYAPSSELDEFVTTDSVPCSVQWLREEVDARVQSGQPKLANVMPLAPVFATWLGRRPEPFLGLASGCSLS